MTTPSIKIESSPVMDKILKRWQESKTYDKAKLIEYSIGNRQLILVDSDSVFKDALETISTESIIGFDSEQKPTFKAGEPANDLALIQIATSAHCFIFQLKMISDVTPLIKLLSNVKILKVGFGLKNDVQQFRKEYHCSISNYIDLATSLKKIHKEGIGAKRGVYVFLNQHMVKSKKVTRSNWAKQILEERQLKYASEDATAPLDIYKSIRESVPELSTVFNDKNTNVKQPRKRHR